MNITHVGNQGLCMSLQDHWFPKNLCIVENVFFKEIVLREKEAKISKTRRFLKKPFLWLIRNIIFYKNWIFRPVEISTGRENSTFVPKKSRKIRFWAKLWLFFERNKIPCRICNFSNFRNFLTRRIFYETEKIAKNWFYSIFLIIFQPKCSCHITNTFFGILWNFGPVEISTSPKISKKVKFGFKIKVLIFDFRGIRKLL